MCGLKRPHYYVSLLPDVFTGTAPAGFCQWCCVLCEAGVPVTQTMTNPQTSSNISLLRFHWQGWTCTWTQINPIFLTSCLGRLYTYEYEIRTKMSMKKKKRFNNRRVFFFVVVEIMVLCSLVSHGSVRSVFSYVS